MQTVYLFLLSSILLTLSPGPDLLLVITLSLQYSFRKVVLFIVGLCSGLVLHTLLLILGWQQFLEKYPQAVDVFKAIGALYFAYLSIQVFRTKRGNDSAAVLVFRDGFSLWKKGLLMNVLNPKVGLFFWLFFPGFLFTEQWTLGGQYLALGLLFALQAFGVMTLMGLLASRLRETDTLEKVISSDSIRYFTAILLAILALYLGLS